MVLFRTMLLALRWQVVWYGVGLAAWAAIECAIFPSMRDSIGNVEYPQALLDAFGVQGMSLADPRGFFGVEFFSLAPLVTGAFIVFAATAALAGEESSGTMEILASLPLSRAQMFAQKALAVGTAAVAVIGLTVLGWAGAAPFVDIGSDLSWWALIGGTFVQLPFVGFMIATGLFFGAVAPSRSSAAASTGAILIVSYLLVAIGSATDAVSALKYMSPYYYADLSGVLVDGITVWHHALLWLLTAAIGWCALGAFEGRELGGERWQFEALLRRSGSAYAAPGPEQSARAAHMRALVYLQSRSRLWWAAALAVLVLLGVVAGGAFGYGFDYAQSRPRTITVDGRIDAASADVLAPSSGLVRLLTVAEGDDVQRGEAIGWIVDSLGVSVLPIRAPISGRLTKVNVQSGQFAVVGTVAAVIYDLGSLHVALEVREDDIAKIVTGQRVDVSFTSLGAEATTYVETVTPIPLSADAARVGQSRKYQVECPLDEPDVRLLVGLPVKARIYVP